MPSESSRKRDPNELGALWLKVTSAGDDYMTGSVTIDGVETRVVCWQNTKGKSDKAPAWRIMRSLTKQERDAQRVADEEATPF